MAADTYVSAAIFIFADELLHVFFNESSRFVLTKGNGF